jgi:hypothetical protein
MGLANSRAIVLLVSFALLMLLPASPEAEERGVPSGSNGDELGSTRSSSKAVPHTDWSRFRRILIHPLEVAHTTNFELGAPHHRSVFGPEEIERARRYFRWAFERLVAEHYPIVTRPGLDVLRVEAVLVDPVLDRGDWLQPGRSTWRRITKTVSLAVVLRDSENGALLHQIELGPLTDRLAVEEGPVQFWGGVRRVFDRAAMQVRWTLETPPSRSARSSDGPTPDADHRDR